MAMANALLERLGIQLHWMSGMWGAGRLGRHAADDREQRLPVCGGNRPAEKGGDAGRDDERREHLDLG